MGYMALRQKLR